MATTTEPTAVFAGTARLLAAEIWKLNRLMTWVLTGCAAIFGVLQVWAGVYDTSLHPDISVGHDASGATAATLAAGTLSPLAAGAAAAGLMASLPGALFIAILAGGHVGGEWTGRTIRTLVAQHGRRWSILTAKVVSVWLTAAAMMAACWAGLAVAGPILAAAYHLPASHQTISAAAGLGFSQTARALLVLAVFAALSVLAAVVTRSSTGTIALMVGAVMLILLLAGQPGIGAVSPADWVQGWMGTARPDCGGHAFLEHLPVPERLPPRPAGNDPDARRRPDRSALHVRLLRDPGRGPLPPVRRRRLTATRVATTSCLKAARNESNMTSDGRWWSPRRTDVLVAGSLLVWAADLPGWPSRGQHPTPGMLGLATVLALPFLCRRTLPLPVFAVSLVVFAAASARGDSSNATYSAAAAATLAAAWGVGAHGGRRARIAAHWVGGAVLAAAAVITVSALRSSEHRSAAMPFALLGIALVLGETQRARQDALGAGIDAAHLQERTRIARELHDVLAHQLSGIALQAGAARLAADRSAARLTGPTDPPAATDGPPSNVLATIEQLAREALGELSHLLGVLRKESAEPPAHTPAPVLGGLDDLLAGARATGTPVTMVVAGVARPLSAGVQLSAYRIVQESLTNIAKHAPGATTRVYLVYHPDRLSVRIDNDPSPAPSLTTRVHLPRRTSGRGIIGMRERAELFGGYLHVAPGPDGGMTVSADLPDTYQTEETRP